MLVKHNLYIKPEFQKATLYSQETLCTIVDGCMKISNLIGYMTRFINEDYDPLKDGMRYYIGFKGNYTNEIQIYKGSYRIPTSKRDMHYVQMTSKTAHLHIQALTNADVYIKSVFLT